MSIPTRSFDQVLRRTLANFRTSFPGWPLGSKRFLGRSARAVALTAWGGQKHAEDLDRDIVPSRDSSDDALSAWAEELGLPDGQGGYGRLKATTASGGEATLTGEKGTSYPNGALATAEDGTTIVQLDGVVAISGSPPGFGSVTGKFVAVTTGMAGNLPVGTVLSWQNPPAGADETFTLTSPLEGAIDLEDNPRVYARIVSALQDPRRGGSASDYRFWSEEGGAYAAFIYPKRDGTGTVDVVVVMAGSGQARAPSQDRLDEIADIILAAHPAGIETVNVYAPNMPNDAGHVVRVRVTPFASKYAFDWDSGASGYSVDTYTAGAPATLKLNTLAPASLKAAIDAYVGLTSPSAPRLQVLSTGSVINAPIRAVAWSDGGGKTTLTLETVPTGWVAPTAGDAIYAYGPVVATIAAGELALCDALGPSRVSGYGDDLVPWSDELTISGIIQVAENAIDSDGAKLIAEVLEGGATIDGSAADVTGSDNTDDPPELLYLSHIAVTP